MKSKRILLSPLLMALALGLLWLGGAQAAAPSIPLDSNIIHGHLTTDESTPRPVQSALVTVANTEGEQYTALSGPDGAYTVTLPTGRGGWIVAAQPTPLTLPPGLAAPPPHPVFFRTAQPETKTVDFVFPASQAAEGSITGRVLVSGTPPTLPPFTVTVRAAAFPWPGHDCPTTFGQYETTTDPVTGAFDLSVPPGCYAVALVPSNLAYLPPAPSAVTVTEGAATEMGNLYLRPPGNLGFIEGHVLTPDDAPAANLEVVAVNQETMQPIPPVETDTQGAFRLSVLPGTWRVAVMLEEGDPYMPYRAEWQTTVEITTGQTVTGVVLRVVPTDAIIHANLLHAEDSTPATDACGVAAAYQQGDPSVYNYAVFTGGAFDLPVISGTYRLAIIPNPDLEALGIPRPGRLLDCEAGKYLVATVNQVSATTGATSVITVPLHSVQTTVHDRFWDIRARQSITGVDGVALGWLMRDEAEGMGTWTAALIDGNTGVGNMPAAAGRYLVAYRTDPVSDYRAVPGIISFTVPTGQAEMDLNLPVLRMGVTVTGTVLDPHGNPVAGAVVVASGMGMPNELRSLLGPGKISALVQRDHAVSTRADGTFTLRLSYGAYHISVFGPPSIIPERGGEPWISPAPQNIILRPAQEPPALELRYRAGNATIHGNLTLSGTQTTALGQGAPVLVWAATAHGPNASEAGHTKDFVALEGGHGTYSLPALQGQRWLVGALYEHDGAYWYTQTLVSVESADISLDLLLDGPHDLGSGVARWIDAAGSFYTELSDGASLFVPGNLLGQGGRKGVILQASLQDALARMDVSALGFAPNGSLAEGMSLLSRVYHLRIQDGDGNPMAGALGGPVVLRIPYGQGGILPLSKRASSVEADSIKVLSYNALAGTWSEVDDYVVDTDSQEVVIFADQPGSYVVVESNLTYTLHLPLLVR